MDFLHSSPKHPTAPPGVKQPMAVLAGPTRSFCGWANVRTSKISRAVRRYVIIRSSKLTVCATDNPRSQILSVPITGATMTLTSSRWECHLRTATHRLWIQWPCDADLRTCKAAFEFANRHIEDYFKLVTHRQLGKGRYSEVVFAFDTATGDHAAVKIINKGRARSTEREFAEKEVCIRMTVQHPCIVQTLDIFETPFDLFVVMELMNGSSLDRRLHKYNEPLNEHEARIVMCRLFSALRHLHSRRIAHRNVKPQNIFLDSPDDIRWPYTVKLSDFSLACFIDDPDAHKQVVGTPEYLAPCATIMTRTDSGERAVLFGTEIDMWAAGVTLYNLLSLELPFEGEYAPEVFKKSRLGRVHFGPMFDDVSLEAKSLILSLLNVDNRKRPTAQTVMLHPWFEPLVEYSGSVDDDGLNYEIIDDGAVTGAPCVFESYEEYVLSDGIRRFRSAVRAVRMMIRLAKIKLGGFFPTFKFDPMGGPSCGRRLPYEKRFQFNVSGIDIAPISKHGPPLSAQGGDNDAIDVTNMNMKSNTSSGIRGAYGVRDPESEAAAAAAEILGVMDMEKSGGALIAANDAASTRASEGAMPFSGINGGAPGPKDFGDGSLYMLQGRASGTVMSRVSTGSTVKSRSSRGTDCGTTCGSVAPIMTLGGSPNCHAQGLGLDCGNGSGSEVMGDGEGGGGGVGGFRSGRTMTTTTRLTSTITTSTTVMPSLKMERSDTSIDYFGGRQHQQHQQHQPFGGGKVDVNMEIGLPNEVSAQQQQQQQQQQQRRMLSDTADLVSGVGGLGLGSGGFSNIGLGMLQDEEKGMWRRRRKGR